VEIGRRPGTRQGESNGVTSLCQSIGSVARATLRRVTPCPNRIRFFRRTAPVPAPDDVLERLVREGARKMLQDALEAEVDEFLGRRRYQRTDENRGYRNGHLPERTIGVGMGAVEVSLPRVSDVPPAVSAAVPSGEHDSPNQSPTLSAERSARACGSTRRARPAGSRTPPVATPIWWRASKVPGRTWSGRSGAGLRLPVVLLLRGSAFVIQPCGPIVTGLRRSALLRIIRRRKPPAH
jgi:hypothetical protein